MTKKDSSNNPTLFRGVVTALLDENKPFPAHLLQSFSDIDGTNLKSLIEAWPRVDKSRKQRLLEDLKDLAESDTLVNFEALGKALLEDPDAEVRILAAGLLWECEDRTLIPLYLKQLKSDKSAEVRAAFASALGLFVLLGELDEIPEKVIRPVEDELLQAARQDGSSLVRRRALEALGASSREEVPALIESSIHQKNPEWVVSALTAIGRSSDEQWEKHVLSRLRHPNDDIRWEAIKAAGEIGLPGARQPLLDLLEDEEDLEIRRAAVTALSKIGGEGVRGTLEELLSMEDDEEEIEFLEQSLEDLIFAEDSGQFGMFGFDPDEDLPESPSPKKKLK